MIKLPHILQLTGNGTSCFPKTSKEKSKQHCLYIIPYTLKMNARNQLFPGVPMEFISFRHAVAPLKKKKSPKQTFHA